MAEGEAKRWGCGWLVAGSGERAGGGWIVCGAGRRHVISQTDKFQSSAKAKSRGY